MMNRACDLLCRGAAMGRAERGLFHGKTKQYGSKISFSHRVYEFTFLGVQLSTCTCWRRSRVEYHTCHDFVNEKIERKKIEERNKQKNVGNDCIDFLWLGLPLLWIIGRGGRGHQTLKIKN